MDVIVPSMLIQKIMRHIDMLSLVFTTTKKIEQAAARNNLESVVHYSDNRDRLIKALTETQHEIETSISNKNYNADQIEIISSWGHETCEILNQIDSINFIITQLLETSKKSVASDIAKAHHNKQVVRGYNLNDVTR